jgi:hypothetical protein
MKFTTKHLVFSAIVCFGIAAAWLVSNTPAQVISGGYIQGPSTYSAITNTGTWEVRPAAAAARQRTSRQPVIARWRERFGGDQGVTNAALPRMSGLPWVQPRWRTRSRTTQCRYCICRRASRRIRLHEHVTRDQRDIGNVAAVRREEHHTDNGLIGSSLAGTLFVESSTSMPDNMSFKSFRAARLSRKMYF